MAHNIWIFLRNQEPIVVNKFWIEETILGWVECEGDIWDVLSCSGHHGTLTAGPHTATAGYYKIFLRLQPGYTIKCVKLQYSLYFMPHSAVGAQGAGMWKNNKNIDSVI